MTSPVAPVTPARRSSRTLVVGAVIVVALGFVVFRGLGEATVFFLTADEALAQRQELGDDRFRIEGLVMAGSVSATDDGVSFTITEAGSQVDVVHVGDPPELFQPGIPVVLEGNWAGNHFASDRILVRHTEEYKADNPARVEDYSLPAQGVKT